MIDIHCHILPAVDDGSESLEQSLEMVRMEHSGGTKAFIVTPHVIEKRDYDRVGSFAAVMDQVQAAIDAEGIDVRLYPGGEIYPMRHLLDGVDAKKPVTLAGKGRHMLVDLPMGALPNDFESILYELQLRGITPILAHPERCGPFQVEPDHLEPLLEKGVACQVNVGSLAGKYGPGAKAAAEVILRRRWANFLASDMHHAGRRPYLASGAEAARTFLDEDYVRLLTFESAQCVLEGKELPARPPRPPEEKPKKKSFFGSLFSRG